jgi:prepilin-type N-terminal cleavage/methylation domain-containing protein
MKKNPNIGQLKALILRNGKRGYLRLRIFVRRLFYRVLRKARYNHISKSNNTNNSSQNRPISKIHKFILQKTEFILHPQGIKNQSLVSNALRQDCHGFSLIEVMIVSSLLAGMAYFGMELLETMKGNQKEIEGRFVVQSIHSEINQILKTSKHCLESFKAVKLGEEFKKEKRKKDAISSIKKIYIIQKEGLNEEDILEKFKIYDEKNPIAYSGIRILEYALIIDNEDYYNEEVPTSELTLQVKYSYKIGTKRQKEITKDISLSFQFNEEREIVNCGDPATGGSALRIINPLVNREFFNKTGNEACLTLNKSCNHVFSNNYATKVYGNSSLSSLCAINYNTTENDFIKGSPVGPIHDCELKLGVFNTYVINKKEYGVTCQAIFMATCD